MFTGTVPVEVGFGLKVRPCDVAKVEGFRSYGSVLTLRRGTIVHLMSGLRETVSRLSGVEQKEAA